jgi:hypothetical protein
MNRSSRSSCIRIVIVGLLSAVMTAAGPAVGSANASDATACGLMTQHEMAKAFDLQEALFENTVLREPGNPAGVVHVRCRASAWKGEKPMNATQRRRALLSGTFAQMRIETWVADPGPYEGAWLANFPHKLEGLKERAEAQFLNGSLKGSTFAPPHYGAEGAIGYKADTAKTTKVRAFWWTAATGEIVSFTIEEARGRPAVSSLKTLAARMVPGVAT